VGEWRGIGKKKDVYVIISVVCTVLYIFLNRKKQFCVPGKEFSTIAITHCGNFAHSDILQNRNFADIGRIVLRT
jgi:hypothetical protein